LDILQIIRRNIDAVPDGPHSKGLRSILGHIEVAFEHLARGQLQKVDSAFTDAIYRTNQAFEGSIKEAYRVLAAKDPGKKTPFEIEKYLQDNKIFRDRVLTQFTNYRTEWRNPSTHDYSLDFDEDEAFLAIVSVSAFSKLLIDQIIEKLNFSAVTEVLEQENVGQVVVGQPRGPLVDRIAGTIIEFMTDYKSKPISKFQTEAQLVGAVTAYLSKIYPSDSIEADVLLSQESRMRADMIVKNGNEQIIIEFKRLANMSIVGSGMRQLENYLELYNATEGVLFIYGGNDVSYRSIARKFGNFTIVLVGPESLFD
jgi:hypothetical protein